jgi:membrane protein
VLSFLDLEQVYTETIAPKLRDATSEAVFAVVDRSVEQVLGTQRGFWLTLGLGLALWEISGAVRAAMRALNDVYGADEERSLVRRFAVSLALAAALAVLLGGAAVALQVVPRVAARTDVLGLGPVAVAAGWAVAVVLMILAVGLVLRFAPQVSPTRGWLGFVTVLVVGGWALASVLFAVYATQLASYGSIYSSLGIVILLLSYLYLSAVVFLGATQVDALVRRFAGDLG